MRICILLFSLLIINFSPVVQAAWPTESNSAVKNEGYGAECRRCTTHFSDGYCSPNCCSSCKSIAGNYSLTTDQGCRGVCSVSRTFTSEDQALNQICHQPDAESNSQCAGATEFLDSGSDPRQFERRQDSCDEAAQKVATHCSDRNLNSIIPVDVFNLAKKISEAPTCNLNDINNYKLKSSSSNPAEALAQCSSSFNACKTYCFDQNTIQGQTYESGQLKYQNTCQPMYAGYAERIAAINEVKIHIEGCTGEVDPDITKDDGSGGEISSETAAADGNPNTQNKASSQGVDGVQTSKNGWNGPNAVYNNMNQLMGAVQQFLPQGNSGGSLGGTVNPTANPYTSRSQLTHEEYYGPEYQGEPDAITDDLDFDSSGGFDQPTNLRNTGAANRQNPGRGGMGGGAGGFSGMGGVGGGGNNANKGKRPAGRGKPSTKDKTLFGKRESSSGGAAFASSDDSGKTMTGYSSKYGVGRADPKVINNKRQFNASKYHDQILASYQKGMNTQARRRAAGLSSEDPNGYASRGYNNWHLENKIHPETVSLFMQMRVCYNKKYTSGFAQTCEGRR